MDKLDLSQFVGSTPEPWRTAIDLAALRRPGQMVVANFDCMGQHKSIICVQTGGANARLIAAAPTLLRELKEARAEIERLKSAIKNEVSALSATGGITLAGDCLDEDIKDARRFILASIERLRDALKGDLE